MRFGTQRDREREGRHYEDEEEEEGGEGKVG